MAQVNEVKNALVKKHFTELEVALKNAFEKCSGLVLNKEKLISVVYSQIKRNPKLSQCNVPSIVASVLVCGELGLMPGHGIHLVPYANKNNKDGSKDCHTQLDYKGVCNLFYRHGDANKIQAIAVDKNDDFSFEYGTNEYLRHKPAKEKSGETVAYYAIAFIKDRPTFLVMYPDEIRKHGLRYSKQVNRDTQTFWPDSLWATNFDDMAKKTVLLQLAKHLPSVPVEIDKALEAERAERTYDARFGSYFEMPKKSEEEDVIDAENEIIDDSENKDNIAPQQAQTINNACASKPDKAASAEKEKKMRDLKFQIALAKNKGINVIEQDYMSMDIDEALEDIKKITGKELF